MDELPFSKSDTRKVIVKWLYSVVFSIVFTIFPFVVLYFYYDGFSIISLIFGILFLIGIYSFLTNLSKLSILLEDLKFKEKIVTTVVISKREIKRFPKRDETDTLRYIIYLKGDDNITYYEVTKKHYKMLNTNNIINLEYSKYSKSILSIKWKNINIENKFFLK